MASLSESKRCRVGARCALLLLSVLLTGASISAQRRPAPRPAVTPTPAQANDAPPAAQAINPDTADLSITATVTARELKFDEVPNASVEFTGQPRRTTVWDAVRHNLPRPVQPGVTYRDIGIQLVITSVFADIDRIVAEALGEVPRTDDTPTTDTPPLPDNAPPPLQSAGTKDHAPAQAALAQTAAPPRATAATHNTSPARNAHGRRAGRPR